MSVLFDDSRVNTRPFCSGASLWLSVAMHATVAIVLIVVPIRAFEKPSTPPSRSRTVFIMPAAAVITPPVRIPVPRLTAPPKPKPTSPIAAAAVPQPPAVAPIVARAAEPAAAPKVVAVPERPIERPETRRPLETGLFERTNVARTTQVAAAVTTGGFGTPAMVARDASTAGAVKTGGFGSDAAAPRRTADGQVRTAGFDQRASAPAPASVPAPKSVDRPVEIVFKPSPEYTEEARRARIEGTVYLELEFTAAGDVRVLRIVSGLGHGLDEAAQRAALRIRFKPAQSDGTPVDSRATVHITFRLS
jgi:TonB family protein